MATQLHSMQSTMTRPGIQEEAQTIAELPVIMDKLTRSARTRQINVKMIWACFVRRLFVRMKKYILSLVPSAGLEN